MRSGYLLFAPLACCCAGVRAEHASPNQGVLGDWGGARTRLYGQGIDFQLSYFAEPAGNVRGGTEKLVRSADQFVAGATFDLDKLWGWRSAKVQLTLTDRNGKNLSADAGLDTLMQVQQVYGRGSIVRLTELSYEQSFLDGRLDVKLGRLGVGADFFPWSCEFMNLSFCGSLPGNVVSTWYNWPVSQWGARVSLDVAPEWQLKIGAYQVDPAWLENRNGLALGSPSGTIGTLVPFEIDWTPKLGSARLPGAWRVGAWYDSSNQPDVYLSANGAPQATSPGVPPLMHGSESGFYVNIQQQVTAAGSDASRGLSLFANYVRPDQDTATIGEIASVGLRYAGPFDARPQDVLGFAAGRTRYNPRAAANVALLNANGANPAVPVPDAEYPFEVFYNVNATRWLSLCPLVQYIHRPGGTSANPDAVVLGMNVNIVF